MMDVKLVNSLICMHALFYNLVEAHRLFRNLQSLAASTWNAIISAHVRLGENNQAVALYQEMLNLGVEADGFLYITVLKACTSGILSNTGMQVHAQVIMDGVESDIFVGNTLVDMYLKCQKLRVAQHHAVAVLHTLLPMVAMLGFEPDGCSLEAVALLLLMVSENGCEAPPVGVGGAVASAPLMHALDLETVLEWNVSKVVQLVEALCDTSEYSSSIYSHGVNGKALSFMTMEGWMELGITSLSHKHTLVGWCRSILERTHNRISSLHISNRALDISTKPQLLDGGSSYIHPDSLPITYERIFRPDECKHMFPIVGKPFLKMHHSKQHNAYCRGMDMIRAWCKENSFQNMGVMEFSHINLRKEKEQKRALETWIESKIGSLPVLYWTEDNVQKWRVHDAYKKIIGWRNYKRHKAPQPFQGVSHLPSSNSQEMDATVDVMRRRHYAVEETRVFMPNHVDYVQGVAMKEHAVRHVLVENNEKVDHPMQDNLMEEGLNCYIVETTEPQNNLTTSNTIGCYKSQGVGHSYPSVNENNSLSQMNPAMEECYSSYEEEESEVVSLGNGSLLEFITKEIRKPVVEKRIHMFNHGNNSEQHNLEVVLDPFSKDVDTPTMETSTLLLHANEHVVDNSSQSTDKRKKFVSLSEMMGESPLAKTIPTNSGKKLMHAQKRTKAKALKDVLNDVTKEAPFGNAVTMVEDEIGALEAIAVKAMGTDDIDEMYKRLWTHIKELSPLNKSIFKECTSKSDPSFLLRCYVTWIHYSHGGNLDK
ncbi:hypothetical protein L7F22_030425 [Adiantum nelumboides]|nr:hypothetical protein [Adiantum nelumboides]